MKAPTNFAELQEALLLLDGRLTLEHCQDDGSGSAWCAHLATSTKGARVSIEFGTTIGEAITAAFARYTAKVERYRQQHPEVVS